MPLLLNNALKTLVLHTLVLGVIYVQSSFKINVFQ